ncbi:helix-turn-helix domain-containing protein [Achromobacter aegrifaciens]
MELLRFGSFGEYEAAVVDVDLKVRLLGPQDGGWRLGHADVGGITVQRGIEVVPNLCEAAVATTHLMFLISDAGPASAWLNGVALGRDKLGALAPGRGFVFRADGPNSWVTIAVPLSSPMFQADDEVGCVLRHWTQATTVLNAMPSRIEALRTAALRGADSRMPREAGRRLIERAIAAMVYSRRPQPMAGGRPAVSWHELCNATLNRFRLKDKDKRNVIRFDGLEVGDRSLRTFFQHCFGLSPMQYLHLRQLHAIYAALTSASAGEWSISDIFERQGYPYTNYALTQYRALFGETPSVTRRRYIVVDRYF